MKYIDQILEELTDVNEKLTSRSKKETENFMWAKLSTVTQEQHIRKLSELFHQ